MLLGATPGTGAKVELRFNRSPEKGTGPKTLGKIRWKREKNKRTCVPGSQKVTSASLNKRGGQGEGGSLWDAAKTLKGGEKHETTPARQKRMASLFQ